MAPVRPLAWESPYAVEAALEKAKRQKKKEKTYPSSLALNHIPQSLDIDGSVLLFGNKTLYLISI